MDKTDITKDRIGSMKCDSFYGNIDLNKLLAQHIMGYKWMRFHDIQYESPDGPLTRTLCPPGEWLDDNDPKYVECNLSNPEEVALIESNHIPRSSPKRGVFAPTVDIDCAMEVVDVLFKNSYYSIELLKLIDNTYICILEDRTTNKKADYFFTKSETKELSVCKAAMLFYCQYYNK